MLNWKALAMEIGLKESHSRNDVRPSVPISRWNEPR